MKAAPLVVVLLPLLFGGCGETEDRDAKMLAEVAVADEFYEREWEGEQIKCPHCPRGWGFKLDHETDEDPLLCWRRGPENFIIELTEDGKYVREYMPEKPPISPSAHYDDYMRAAQKLSRQAREQGGMFAKGLGDGFCGRKFTYGESIEKFPENYENSRRAYEERTRAVRRQEREQERLEAAKSPEQRELEKITKELKALREEVKKKK